MDLIKSGSYIDIFSCQNMCNNKSKHSGGVSCSAYVGFVMSRLNCFDVAEGIETSTTKSSALEQRGTRGPRYLGSTLNPIFIVSLQNKIKLKNKKIW